MAKQTVRRGRRLELIEMLQPLDEFYLEAGQPMPEIASISGEEVPQPYRALLVHEGDMTPTLEKFHGARIFLKVLNHKRSGSALLREVVLLCEGTSRPVEFGAIRINLKLFPKDAQNEILEGRLPLGGILAKHAIQHSSRPMGYLRVESDDVIGPALGLHGSTVLFGRRNTLLDSKKRPLAEIVEILPPEKSAS